MKLVKYIRELFEESYRVLVNPKKHWLRVKAEEDIISGGFRQFFMLGLFLLVVASVLGDLMFESEYGFILQNTIIKVSRKVLLLVLTLSASNMLMYELSRMFHVPVGFETSRKVVTYSMMPLVLITILVSLFPFFDVVSIVAFYGFYLMYSALNVLFDLKFEKNLPYLASLYLSMITAYGIIAFLLSKLTALIIY